MRRDVDPTTPWEHACPHRPEKDHRKPGAVTAVGDGGCCEALAFGFVIAGIVFSDNRLIGYSLMGVGVALAIVDNILVRRRP